MSGIGRRAALLVFCSMLLTVSSFAAKRPDDLAELRSQALAAVNADRADHALPALELSTPLNEAAQLHAGDMLDRRYFAHESPDGTNAQDRYLRFGGGRWRLVEENIAQCKNCPTTIDHARIEALEKGWMNSPEHRANILRGGLDRFGYGITVDESGTLYAVQTFSGPGMPIGMQDGAKLQPISKAEAGDLALEFVNDARAEQNLPALRHSKTLDDVATELLRQMRDSQAKPDLNDAVTAQVRRRFKALQANSATCGGCGKVLARGDLDWLKQQWLKQADNVVMDKTMTSFGFAATADGDGKKLALAILGAAR